MNRIKKIILAIVILCNVQLYAQGNAEDQQLIENLVEKFKEDIVTKNSDSFLDLFVAEENVSWVGNGSRGEQFGSPSSFMRMLQSSTDKMREDFHHVEIWNDEMIAVVTFDYGFFINDSLSNWGKESWMLIKQKGTWKITSVNFSMIMPHQKEYPYKN